jgi:hypothetical protein
MATTSMASLASRISSAGIVTVVFVAGRGLDES